MILGRGPVPVAAIVVAAGLAVSGSAAAADHVVEITEFAFRPATLVVRPGDTVTWINRDIAPHTATAEDGSWDTGELARNREATVVMTGDGGQAYVCAFHPAMTGTISVTGGN